MLTASLLLHNLLIMLVNIMNVFNINSSYTLYIFSIKEAGNTHTHTYRGKTHNTESKRKWGFSRLTAYSWVLVLIKINRNEK